MATSDIDHFNKWALTYDKSIMQRWYFGPIHSKMLGLLERNNIAESPSSILDIGCGTGRLLKAAALRWPKAQIFGVDLAKEMISQAKQHNPGAIYKVSPAESLPFSDQTMDLVFSSMSFHHWSDQSKGILEIARVLRPNGLFCLADHSLVILNWSKEKAASRKKLLELIGNAGLTVIAQKRLRLRFVLITLAQKR